MNQLQQTPRNSQIRSYYQISSVHAPTHLDRIQLDYAGPAARKFQLIGLSRRTTALSDSDRQRMMTHLPARTQGISVSLKLS